LENLINLKNNSHGIRNFDKTRILIEEVITREKPSGRKACICKLVVKEWGVV
jgi:hypothetical protein